MMYVRAIVRFMIKRHSDQSVIGPSKLTSDYSQFSFYKNEKALSPSQFGIVLVVTKSETIMRDWQRPEIIQFVRN